VGTADGRSEGEDDLPAAARAAREDPRAIRALADLFRRNSRDARGNHTVPGQAVAEALAAQALARLLDPDTAMLADIGGLRLHLSVPSEQYPGPCVIHAAAWDDDAEVWRQVGEVPLAEPEGPEG
jgi:hypothetical protein